MKILLVHNFYQHPGGEDNVVRYQLAMLRERGHEVSLFFEHNDSIRNAWSKISTLFRVAYNTRAKQALAKRIKEFRPDIVHVHNIFPLLSASIFDACLEAGVPSVMTLHNYRILCPTCFLYHEESVRERSLHHSCWWTVPKRVYHNSIVGTAALAFMVEFHKRRKTWNTRVNCLIALTQFSKRKFVEGGISPDRIVVKPNASPWVPRAKTVHERNGALYVGRLSEEKGVRLLMNAWRDMKYPLRVAGDGPLAALVRSYQSENVIWLGQLTAEDIRKEMMRAAFVVIPSIWYEMFCLVVVEAFSCGLPVIASNIGGLADIVRDGVTGLCVENNNQASLAEKVRWAIAHPSEMQAMGSNARIEYEQLYSPDTDYTGLMDIYHSVICGR